MDYVKIIDGEKEINISQKTVNEWGQDWVTYCNKTKKQKEDIDNALGDMNQIE